MRLKGALTILNKRAKFFGTTVEELVQWIDNGFDENHTTLVAYEVYKMDQGYYWSGVNFETWVKKETA